MPIEPAILAAHFSKNQRTMPELSKVQVADLLSLKQRCQEFGTDLVVIGAIAFQVHFPEDSRHTGDIDFAVALDLNEFAELENFLKLDGWTRNADREHRWRSTGGTLIDLIPAGAGLRKAKKIIWPDSKFTMSLVGFDHVFSRGTSVQIAEDLELRVIPPVVLMLLKIVAFMDDQNRRAKDLLDIRSLMRLYETGSERLFSDVVLDAKLEDFDLANALLLGLDLSCLCTHEEEKIVWQFLDALDETKPAWTNFVRSGFRNCTEEAAQAQLAGFKKGFEIENERPEKQ
jgi:predicted nucleotidyltransferase